MSGSGNHASSSKCSSRLHAPTIGNSPTPSTFPPNDVPVVMPGSITPTRMERDHGHVHSHAHSRHGLDPKRRQTLQSLLDALVELQGDDEAFGSATLSGSKNQTEPEEPTLAVDEQLQNAGAEEFRKFERRVNNLDRELRAFANASRQLGSSVGILSSAFHLRTRLAAILFLFRENAASLFPRKVSRQALEALAPRIRSRASSAYDIIQSPPDEKQLSNDTSPPKTGSKSSGKSKNDQNKDTRRKRRHAKSFHSHVAAARPVVLEPLDPEDFPQQFELFACDVATFLRSLTEFPEFSDEGVESAITAFEADMRYRASCLKDFEGQFRYPAVQRYLHDLTTEMGEHLDIITNSLSMFLEIGIPTIRFAQKHTASNLLNLTTVATFFSAVTATTLQFSFDKVESTLDQSVNSFWFCSLVFSIASAVNSLLGLTWKQAMYRSPGHRVPWWVLIWIKRSPLIFLVVSVAAFSAGLCLFAYSSHQSSLTTTLTTVFTAFSSFGLVAVSAWFAFERWAFSRHRGKKWLMDVLAELKAEFAMSRPMVAMRRANHAVGSSVRMCVGFIVKGGKKTVGGVRKGGRAVRIFFMPCRCVGGRMRMKGCCATGDSETDVEEDVAGIYREGEKASPTSEQDPGILVIDTKSKTNGKPKVNGAIITGAASFATSPSTMSPMTPYSAAVSNFTPIGVAYSRTVSAASLVRSDTAHGHGVATADTTTVGRTSSSMEALHVSVPTPTSPRNAGSTLPSSSPGAEDGLGPVDRARLAIVVRNMMRMRALAKSRAAAREGEGADSGEGGEASGKGEKSTKEPEKHPVVGVTIGTRPPTRQRTGSSGYVSPMASPAGTELRLPQPDRTLSSGGGVETMRQTRLSKLIPELKSLEPVHLFTPHAALVRHLQFSPCGRYLATCSWDRTAMIFDLQGYIKTHRILAHPLGFLGQVEWTPKGDLLLTKTNRGIKVWTSDSGVCTRTIDRKRVVTSISVFPGSEAFISVEGSDVTKLDLSGNVLETIHFSKMRVHDAAITADSQRMLCVATLLASSDGLQPTVAKAEKRIIVYNLDKKEIENQVPVLHDVRGIKLARNGNVALISYEDKAPPQLWKIESLKDRSKDGEQLTTRLSLVQTYLPKTSVEFAGLSYFGGKDDQLVLCAGKAGDIHIWDRETSVLLHHFRTQDLEGDQTCMAWNQAATPFMFATGSHDGAVRIWTTPSATTLPSAFPGLKIEIHPSDEGFNTNFSPVSPSGDYKDYREGISRYESYSYYRDRDAIQNTPMNIRGFSLLTEPNATYAQHTRGRQQTQTVTSPHGLYPAALGMERTESPGRDLSDNEGKMRRSSSRARGRAIAFGANASRDSEN